MENVAPRLNFPLLAQHFLRTEINEYHAIQLPRLSSSLRTSVLHGQARQTRRASMPSRGRIEALCSYTSVLHQQRRMFRTCFDKDWTEEPRRCTRESYVAVTTGTARCRQTSSAVLHIRPSSVQAHVTLQHLIREALHVCTHHITHFVPHGRSHSHSIDPRTTHWSQTPPSLWP